MHILHKYTPTAPVQTVTGHHFQLGAIHVSDTCTSIAFLSCLTAHKMNVHITW